jgi:hypothetical protein
MREADGKAEAKRQAISGFLPGGHLWVKCAWISGPGPHGLAFFQVSNFARVPFGRSKPASDRIFMVRYPFLT